MKSIRPQMFAALAAVVTLATVGLAGPAGAATTGNTTTTFTLTAGLLAITVPASKDLGSVATGTASASAQLGAITVSDNRGALLGSWTTSVSSSDYTTGTATADETIPKASTDYWSGLATASTGIGVFTPGQLLVLNKLALDVSRTGFSAAAVIGNNTATWNPTVIINIPSSAVVGVYTGTVTHSIA